MGTIVCPTRIKWVPQDASRAARASLDVARHQETGRYRLHDPVYSPRRLLRDRPHGHHAPLQLHTLDGGGARGLPGPDRLELRAARGRGHHLPRAGRGMLVQEAHDLRGPRVHRGEPRRIHGRALDVCLHHEQGRPRDGTQPRGVHGHLAALLREPAGAPHARGQGAAGL